MVECKYKQQEKEGYTMKILLLTAFTGASLMVAMLYIGIFSVVVKKMSVAMARVSEKTAGFVREEV